MKRILITLTILFTCTINAQALKVYLLSNHDNAGDHNQVLGISEALKKVSKKDLSIQDINTKNIDPAEIRNQVEKDVSLEKIVVIGAGEGGIDGIKDLQPHPDSLKICLTSHMFLDRFQDPAVLSKVDYIALPSQALDKYRDIIGNKLIETIGVAHNRQPDVPDETYVKYSSSELPSCKTYLGVILGGDAPMPPPSKDIKHFTKEDALQLADYVSKTVKDECVLILNGPRTGKYDENNKEVTTVHRAGNSDPITEAFQKKLTDDGVKTVKVFDFQHNTPENKKWGVPYNSFDLVVGALRANEGGMMIVPGESTSMISEAIDTLPPCKVLVYKNSAMNDVHNAHVQSELDAGRVSILEDYQTIKAPAPDSCKSKFSAAQVIAQKLWETASKLENAKATP
jgi:hypothetical protein